jgi:hypothetical protein
MAGLMLFVEANPWSLGKRSRITENAMIMMEAVATMAKV